MTMEMTMDASQPGYNTPLLLGGDEQLKRFVLAVRFRPRPPHQELVNFVKKKFRRTVTFFTNWHYNLI